MSATTQPPHSTMRPVLTPWPTVRGRPLPRKSLFASPVGRGGKDNLRRIIERFGHDSFDFLLLVYDDSRFEEDCFSRCRIVHDPAPLFWQLKRCLPPELCRRYEYVFIWMDDLEILDFDPQNFLRILRRHQIEVAQPALSPDSVISHPITARRDTPVGRYTDFVEEMAFVFRGDRWQRFWRLIAPDSNPWGWGYDEVAYSVCRFRRLAIIDAETIRHTRQGSYHAGARTGQEEVRHRYHRFFSSRKRTLCPVSDSFVRRHFITPLWLNLYFLYTRSYSLRAIASMRAVLHAGLQGSPAPLPGKSA